MFIAHDVEAQVVPEAEYFTLSNTGGTLLLGLSWPWSICRSTTRRHAGTPTFHFSDVDNLPNDNTTCKTLVEALLTHCRMVGYGEILYRDDASFYGWLAQSSAAPARCSMPCNRLHIRSSSVSPSTTRRNSIRCCRRFCNHGRPRMFEDRVTALEALARAQGLDFSHGVRSGAAGHHDRNCFVWSAHTGAALDLRQGLSEPASLRQPGALEDLRDRAQQRPRSGLSARSRRSPTC